MKIFKALTVVVLSAGLLVACTGTTTNMADASQPPEYNLVDRFTGPDGTINIFCRNGNLFVDKDGYRSGSVQFFYKHEMCAGR